MNSLDAECLLTSLADAEGCTPPLWLHAGDGTLAYRFHDSPNHYSWPPEQVAEAARRWRDEGGASPPECVAKLVAAHRAFIELLDSGGLEQPDSVVHNLDEQALRARWLDPELVVEIDAAQAPEDWSGLERIRAS